jgi:hypothetical protein
MENASMHSAAARVELAADIVLIDQHVSRYTWLVDSRRYVEWSELFVENAVFDQAWQDESGILHPVNSGAGFHLQGRADISRFVFARYGPAVTANLPRPAAGAGHRLVNRLIEVHADTATVKARGPEGQFQYEMALQRTGDGPDGGWKFTHVFIIFNEDRKTPDITGVPVPR